MTNTTMTQERILKLAFMKAVLDWGECKDRNRVNRPHTLCLAFPKGGGYPRVMVEFEQYLMPQETYVYARSTAKKLRAKLLISES